MLQARAKITRNRFRALSKQGKRAAYERNVDLAEITVQIMHQLVPKASGDLDSTIRVEKNPRTGSASAAVGGIAASGKVVDYGLHVNYGTVYQSPQPFIEPAIESAMKRTRNRKVRMYKG